MMFFKTNMPKYIEFISMRCRFYISTGWCYLKKGTGKKSVIKMVIA